MKYEANRLPNQLLTRVVLPLVVLVYLIAGPTLRAAHAVELPSDVTPTLGTIRDHVQAGRLDDAYKSAQLLLKLRPDDDEARLVRGRLLYWRGEVGAAEADVAQVLRTHPNDLDALELQANLQLAQGRLDASLATWQTLLHLGDNRPEVLQKIVAIQFTRRDYAGVRAALRDGGTLSDEQALLLARAEHRWTADLTNNWTWYRTNLWPRLDASAGYRVHDQVTVLGGAYAERRTQAAISRDAWGAKVETYVGKGSFDGMFHVSGSGSGAFLPQVDVRADGTWAFSTRFGAGVWARWARYAPTGGDPSQVLTLGPNLLFHFGSWMISPGALLLRLGDGTLAWTVMVKQRWQLDGRSALFLWLYGGKDPNFIDRLTAAPGNGFTGLIGYDRWFTDRFGLRISVSRIQPTGDFAPFTEASIGIRGRL